MSNNQIVDKGIEKFFFIDELIKNSMPSDLPMYFYHYTSVYGFQSILSLNKAKESNVVLWASRYDCLNDTTEGVIVDDVYKEACNELLSDNLIDRQQYNAIIDLKQNESVFIYYENDNNAVYEDLAYTKEIINGKCYCLECDRFICCFSENSDSLPMWNYYTKDNKYEGYNIEFDVTNLDDAFKSLYGKGVKYELYKVIYNANEQKALIKGFVSKLLKEYYSTDAKFVKDTISEQLFEWSLIFKNKCFEHEKEVRLILSIPKQLPQDVNTEQCCIIKHRFSHGLIIPYIELTIEKACVSGITIGPLLCDNNEKVVQKRILENLLESYGFTLNNNNVKYSEIPVRY